MTIHAHPTSVYWVFTQYDRPNRAGSHHRERFDNGITCRWLSLEFRILAGIHPDTTGQVVASFDTEDQLLPRIAPLIVLLKVRGIRSVL